MYRNGLHFYIGNSLSDTCQEHATLVQSSILILANPSPPRLSDIAHNCRILTLAAYLTLAIIRDKVLADISVSPE
jgi:hypothetical protein